MNFQSGLQSALNNTSTGFSMKSKENMNRLSKLQPSLHHLIVNVRRQNPYKNLGVLENCVHDKIKERAFLAQAVERKLAFYVKKLGPGWEDMPRASLAALDEYKMAPGTHIFRYGVGGISARTSIPFMKPQESGPTHHGIYLFDGIVVDVGSSPKSCGYENVGRLVSSSEAYKQKYMRKSGKGINNFIGLTSIYRFTVGYNNLKYDVWKYEYGSSTAPVPHIFKKVLKAIGVKPYDLFERNCEHWASFILTGIPYSAQAFIANAQLKRWYFYVLGPLVAAIASVLGVSNKTAEAIAKNQWSPDERPGLQRTPSNASSSAGSSPNSNRNSNNPPISNGSAPSQQPRKSKRILEAQRRARYAAAVAKRQNQAAARRR